MMSEIENKVKDVIKRTFNVDIKISESTSPSDISGWDSFGHLNLILELEENFNIKFSDEDMLKLDSVKNINDVVRKYS